ncbi:histidine kinase [Cytophagaceae bacterium YF14B1]|uniref:Histidine kinase n=1 Tax=Xanthocytophaga flava TaxID=3048013 RepID=A0AAE3QL54_9BACT|nr:histidine kinase [Xanthocytophaga flavus]MDJ1481362.1 histidine kinase [Xanthocytophaga flavus]
MIAAKWLSKVKEVIVQFLLILALDLAFGAVTYFSIKSFSTLMDDPSMEIDLKHSFAWLITNNSVESIIICLTLQAFSLVERKIRFIWLRPILLAVCIFAVVHIIQIAIYRPYTFFHSLFHFTPLSLIFGSNIILAGLSVYAYGNYEKRRSRKLNDQQYQLLELKELKTKAELEALQAKINPHFLYNSLNAIASLIHEDPDKAEQMVLLLAKFFRYSTNAKSQYLTRLSEEIEMVKTYLEVEKVRFDDRLEYFIWFEKEELKNCMVPQFLLQPLVENAIKHGISKSMEKGILGIKVLDKQDKLVIVIFDNGVPFPEQLITGYGLRSTQDKLRLLMGEDARMEIINGRSISSQGDDFVNQPHKAIKITVKKQFSPSYEKETESEIVLTKSR